VRVSIVPTYTRQPGKGFGIASRYPSKTGLRESKHTGPGLMSLLTLGIVRFFVVEQGTIQLVTAFGRLHGFGKPGLNSCLSFWGMYKKPGAVVPTSEQIDPYDGELVFTSDGVKCLIDVMICYRIVDPGKALFEVSDYRSAIYNLVQSVLRNECGKLPARSMLQSREPMAANIQKTLERDCGPWGISIRLVEIKNIQLAVQENRS
jgi:regulator of protease activity HflC (stomatin/prohibitin superfamily)